MSKLLDFLTFKEGAPSKPTDEPVAEDRLRKDERDTAILADKYPLDAADIESVSEYRLASLMQYPHF